MTSSSDFQDGFAKNFGPFITKFNIGGRTADQTDLDTPETQKLNAIWQSKQMRDKMFTKEKRQTLQERLAALSSEEREKLENLSDPDMVTWFNRTKVNSVDKNLKTIPGCFYKVQAQGSATVRDCEEMSKIYKRSFASGGLGLVYAWGLIQFLYESRIIQKAQVHPTVFQLLPFAIYSAPIFGIFWMTIKEHSRVLTILDSKYTPIWVRITEQQQL